MLYFKRTSVAINVLMSQPPNNTIKQVPSVIQNCAVPAYSYRDYEEDCWFMEQQRLDEDRRRVERLEAQLDMEYPYTETDYCY